MVDVVQALGISRVVVGIGNDVAETRDVDIVGRQPIADSHLVQVSVTGKREERGMLVLPSKTANGERAAGFEDRNAHGFSADEATGC